MRNEARAPGVALPFLQGFGKARGEGACPPGRLLRESVCAFPVSQSLGGERRSRFFPRRGD
jgi:hypothetical protein